MPVLAGVGVGAVGGEAGRRASRTGPCGHVEGGLPDTTISSPVGGRSESSPIGGGGTRALDGIVAWNAAGWISPRDGRLRGIDSRRCR